MAEDFGTGVFFAGTALGAYQVYNGTKSLGEFGVDTGVGILALATPPPIDILIAGNYAVFKNPQQAMQTIVTAGAGSLNIGWGAF